MSLTKQALHFRSLHKPGTPLLLTNVHDKPSTLLVCSLPQTVALATASYSVAEIQGLRDGQLTLSGQLKGLATVRAGIDEYLSSQIGSAAKLFPLSADLQDGYEDPRSTIRQCVEVGKIVGCNLEDLDNDPTGTRPTRLRDVDEQVLRIKAALAGAADSGYFTDAKGEFAINARTDVLGYGGSIDDVIVRGKKYLEAGAFCVFVWGCGKFDISVSDAKRMSEAFEGRLSLQPGVIGVGGAREGGAARVSVGPLLWRKIQGVESGQEEDVMRKAALEILEA